MNAAIRTLAVNHCASGQSQQGLADRCEHREPTAARIGIGVQNQHYLTPYAERFVEIDKPRIQSHDRCRDSFDWNNNR